MAGRIMMRHLIKMSDRRSYVEIYLLACDGVKETAEGILERPLTEQELAGIYNAGSLMMLELVERSIEASTKDNLSQELLSTSFLDRLADTKREIPKILEEKFLDQPLNPQLIEKLNSPPYVYTAHQILRRMEQTPQENRYQELARILDEPLQI